MHDNMLIKSEKQVLLDGMDSESVYDGLEDGYGSLSRIRYESTCANRKECKIKRAYSFPTHLIHRYRGDEHANVKVRTSEYQNTPKNSRYDMCSKPFHNKHCYYYSNKKAGHASKVSAHLVDLGEMCIFKSSSYTIEPSLIADINKCTIMLKNIPNKYTSSMLIDLLNEEHYGCYDFLYLRMDFLNECNVGYAFINFVDVAAVHTFYCKVHGKGWKKYSSNKIAEVTYASIQGVDALYRKFKNSPILNEQENFRPKMFYKEGPFKGIEKKEFVL